MLARLHSDGIARYIVYGRELAPTTLTPHLQGFVIFRGKHTLKAAIKLLPDCHVTIRYDAATNAQAAEYCKKGGDFVELGALNEQGKRNDLSALADEITEGASLKDVADRYRSTYIRNYRGIQHYKQLITKPYTPSGLRGHWFVGIPESGKSRAAREENPGYYLKPQSKWWCEYDGEKTVILEDFDHGGACLGHYLKLWADRYPVSGETKGGKVSLAYDKFIITTNYCIEDIWPDDKQMQAAIKRRFTVRYFPETLRTYDFGPQEKVLEEND